MRIGINIACIATLYQRSPRVAVSDSRLGVGKENGTSRSTGRVSNNICADRRRRTKEPGFLMTDLASMAILWSLAQVN